MGRTKKESRPINTKLTKQMLVDMGIQQVYWDFDNNQWWIDRYIFDKRIKKYRHAQIPISLATSKKKYTKPKIYYKVTFGYNNKSYSYPLARFLYAWFRDEVPAGMVVDHIDNNPFNNYINPHNLDDPKNNLQLLTPEESIKKRYLDNPNMNFNQWDAINKQKNID